jgi:uncharacterized membrane protein YdjX (TVP38/TMEM64 family)
MPHRMLALLKRFGPAVLVLAAIVAAFVSGITRHLSLHELRDRRELLQAMVHLHPILSAFAYLGAYSVVIALSLPAALPMTLAGGLLFGPIVGGLAAAAGCTLGGTVVFLVCRTAAGDILHRAASPRIAEIEDGVRRDAFFYILTLRLIPITPFGLATIALGFLEIPLATFVGATLLGILPISFIYASLGSSLNRAFATHQRLNLHSLVQPQIVMALVGLALLALAPILLRVLRHLRGRAGA